MKNTVTPEQVKENMQDVIVRTLDDFGKPCTYVTVRMKNGFTLRESTTCVDPANYNEEIGNNKVNGAACHNCLLISETSCEHRNTLLDRHLFI